MPKVELLELLPEQRNAANDAGRGRFERAVARGLIDPRNRKQEANLTFHVQGAEYEFVMRKWEGLPLEIGDDFKLGDLPGGREVKGSRRYPNLLIRIEEDLKQKPDRKYAHVQFIRETPGGGGLYAICGWQWATEAPNLYSKYLPPDKDFVQGALVIPRFRLRSIYDSWLER